MTLITNKSTFTSFESVTQINEIIMFSFNNNNNNNNNNSSDNNNNHNKGSVSMGEVVPL
jgi:hypothetical protein